MKQNDKQSKAKPVQQDAPAFIEKNRQHKKKNQKNSQKSDKMTRNEYRYE